MNTLQTSIADRHETVKNVLIIMLLIAFIIFVSMDIYHMHQSKEHPMSVATGSTGIPVLDITKIVETCNKDKECIINTVKQASGDLISIQTAEKHVTSYEEWKAK